MGASEVDDAGSKIRNWDSRNLEIIFCFLLSAFCFGITDVAFDDEVRPDVRGQRLVWWSLRTATIAEDEALQCGFVGDEIAFAAVAHAIQRHAQGRHR